MLTDLYSYHRPTEGEVQYRGIKFGHSAELYSRRSVQAVSFKLSRIVVAARNFSVELRQLRETRRTGKTWK